MKGVGGVDRRCMFHHVVKSSVRCFLHLYQGLSPCYYPHVQNQIDVSMRMSLSGRRFYGRMWLWYWAWTAELVPIVGFKAGVVEVVRISHLLDCEGTVVVWIA